MYVLQYKELGNIVVQTRKFKYKEDMELFIKRLNPTEWVKWKEN